MAQMVATAAPAANPPLGAKTTEQESANRQGEHEYEDGREIACKEAGHDAPFVVCVRTHYKHYFLR